MTVVNVHAAKTHLSKLIERACAGEEIVIARDSEPVVRLVPVAPKAKRQAGTMKELFSVPPDFFDPLPDDELARWEGGDDEAR